MLATSSARAGAGRQRLPAELDAPYANACRTDAERFTTGSLRIVDGDRAATLHVDGGDPATFLYTTEENGTTTSYTVPWSDRNGGGGRLLTGMEDDTVAPPAAQRVPVHPLDRIRKRITGMTVNVTVLPELRTHADGGEYIVLTVPGAPGVASTGDGRYYLRVGDSCLPVVGDDVLRLANDRSVISWKTIRSSRASVAGADRAALARWTAAIRASDRVKPSVREKSPRHALLRRTAPTSQNRSRRSDDVAAYRAARVGGPRRRPVAGYGP